jgi:hypothetical protein
MRKNSIPARAAEVQWRKERSVKALADLTIFHLGEERSLLAQTEINRQDREVDWRAAMICRVANFAFDSGHVKNALPGCES